MKKLIKYFKELHPLLRLLVVVTLLALISKPVITLSRYLYDVITYNIYSSQNFYFKSDFLAENNPSYTVAGWNGGSDYPLTITMNSILNELKASTVDIPYDILYSCDGDVVCTSNKNDGVISVDAGNRDIFNITLHPLHQYTEKEEAVIHVTATSREPYIKTLSASFVLKVEKVGLSKEITDSRLSPFATVRLTNSKSYYTAKETYGSLTAGQLIQVEEYRSLTQEEKDRCESMSVELEFDPEILQLDMTNKYYLDALRKGNVSYGNYYIVNKAFDSYASGDAISTSHYNALSTAKKANCDGPYKYVTKFKVDLNAISSADIKFYKTDDEANYTYPLVTPTMVVNVITEEDD